LKIPIEETPEEEFRDEGWGCFVIEDVHAKDSINDDISWYDPFV
jgi:hypothetical protein